MNEFTGLAVPRKEHHRRDIVVRKASQKPTANEVKHYRWWLDQELKFVHPEVVVAMGATAVLALAGRCLPIARSRGPAELQGRRGFITVHPSYLLRLPDREAREEAYLAFVKDLRNIHTMAGGSGRKGRVAQQRA